MLYEVITTLVMAFAQAQEMYAAHVGDSRIYWITAHSCHQVTVDDDLASREVKLGYLLYCDAVITSYSIHYTKLYEARMSTWIKHAILLTYTNRALGVSSFHGFRDNPPMSKPNLSIPERSH